MKHSDVAITNDVLDQMPNAMPHTLLGCGPLIKVGCYIILYIPQVLVIEKKTGTIVLTAEFEPWSVVQPKAR